MSRICFICGKKTRAGENVSHSNKKTKREWHPNLQLINIVVKGKKLKEQVCTKCIKAGKIRKALA